MSGIDDADHVTIDTVIREHGIEGPLFLKMDVEGAEAQVLRGAEEALTRPDTRAAICTYHNHDDYGQLSKFMRDRGFDVRTSNGYALLWSSEPDLRPPFFRRGVIYCKK